MYWRGFFYGLFLWLVCLIFPKTVYAYIEPGSVSFFTQALIVALISLIFSIKFSLKFLNSKKLHYFSLYFLSFSSPLFIYAQNPDKISLVQISAVLLTACILTLSCFLLFYLIFKKNRLLAFIASALALIFFFSYGHSYIFLRHFFIVELKLGINTFLPFLYAIIFIPLFYWLIKNKSKLTKPSKFFCFFSLTFFLVISSNLVIKNFFSNTKSTYPPQTTNTTELPDIYYIVFDEYLRHDILKQLLDFDNHSIISFLESKGFYVATNSYANYSTTLPALSSSLNMEYIDTLIDTDKYYSQNRLIFHQMINNNKIAQVLKSKGYTNIHLRRIWGGALRNGNKYVDIDLVFNNQNEFLRVLLATTAFNPFITARSLQSYLPQALKQELSKMDLQIFEELAKIPNNPQPTFTYAHIFLPHAPYFFNRYGQLYSELNFDKTLVSRKTLYLEQLIFTNSKIKELITTILESSSTPPIILLQSDTGPNLSRSMHTSFSQLTQDQIQERFSILNAYYLPGISQDILYDSISPVNSFRLILNQYFNAQLSLLEDKHYYVNYENLYKFHPITLP